MRGTQVINNLANGMIRLARGKPPVAHHNGNYPYQKGWRGLFIPRGRAIDGGASYPGLPMVMSAGLRTSAHMNQESSLTGEPASKTAG